MGSSEQVTANTFHQRLLILHALRLKGMASVSSIADTYLLDHTDISQTLDCCMADGLVSRRNVDSAGDRWCLTPAGRVEGQRLLGEQLGDRSRHQGRDLRAGFADLYRDFLPLNNLMLELCTRWQVRSQDPVELNDHSDPVYDAAIVEQLQEIDGQAQQICGQLESLLDRFSRYGSGFDYALGRIRNGAVEWFTRPTLLSYHTLWFELHEDLLATLGLDRAAETATP